MPNRRVGGLGVVGRHDSRACSAFRISKSPLGTSYLTKDKLTRRLMCQSRPHTGIGPRRDPGLVFRVMFSMIFAKAKYVHIN